jgi:sulfate adenylyltransferase large subunit
MSEQTIENGVIAQGIGGREVVRIDLGAGASDIRHPKSDITMDLLRLITCGSVDDGKSTLIGRLLYDTKSIHQDQWEAVHRSSLKRGDERVDLALLTDGLRAEREQGITIDVAYRYFSTPRRKFILADTPGHVQYTRNMATGASTADLALILIDARQGVLEQTRRHAYIAALLGIGHLVVCINKMDLVGWDRGVFEKIRADFAAFTTSGAGTGGVFERSEATFIPVSALNGDNIVRRSELTPWYTGPLLLDHIEGVPARPLMEFPHARFPVQWVIRPQSDEQGLHDYRGYGGQMAAGELAVGEEVVALPAGQRSRITRIHVGERELKSCRPPQSVSILLEHDVDISRGDMIVKAPANGTEGTLPKVSREFDATIVWMGEQPLTASRKYIVKHGTRYIRAILGPVRSRLNIHTLVEETGVPQLALNEIGRVGVRLASTIAYDPYTSCRGTGAFIVIDEATNNTVGAGMIR